MAGADVGRRLRVVYWPNWRHDAYLDDLTTGLSGVGVESVPLSVRTALTRRADVLHIHWPEMIGAGMLGVPAPVRPLARLARLLGVGAALALARLRHRPIVVTLHNLRPHDEGARRHAWVLRTVAGLATVAVVLSEGGRARVAREHPSLAGQRFEHVPLMDGAVRFPGMPFEEARRELGVPVDATLVVFFGRIRPYKGVDQLVQAFQALDDPSVHLALLGAGTLGDRALEADARRHPRVTWDGSRVPDRQIAAGLAAADVIVLPFHDFENSSSVVVAAASGAPTAVPDLAPTAELAAEFGDDSIIRYSGPLDSTELAALIEQARTRPPRGRQRVRRPGRDRHEVAARQREVYELALRLSGR